MRSMFRVLPGFAAALFILLTLSACAALPPPSSGSNKLKPGDHVGDMVLQKGSPMGQFMLELSGCPIPDALQPGVYTAQECAMRLVGDELRVDLDGWTTRTRELRENNWPALTYDLYVDGQPVDVSAFGTYDKETATTASRAFDVALVHLTPGKHTLRSVMHVDHLINDGWNDYPAGDYDITIPFDFLACC